jgi:hypothetical protein
MCTPTWSVPSTSCFLTSGYSEVHKKETERKRTRSHGYCSYLSSQSGAKSQLCSRRLVLWQNRIYDVWGRFPWVITVYLNTFWLYLSSKFVQYSQFLNDAYVLRRNLLWYEWMVVGGAALHSIRYPRVSAGFGSHSTSYLMKLNNFGVRMSCLI